MSSGQSHLLPWRWPDGLRWTLCFAVVLGAHAAATAALFGGWRAADEPVARGLVIVIELAPVAAAPAAPPSDATPGPQQAESSPEPEPTKSEISAAVTPRPEPSVEKAEPMPRPPLPAEPQTTEVVIPPPRPVEKAQEFKPRQTQANLTSAPDSVPRQGKHAAAPAPGASAHDPDAVPQWKSALVSRLERYKRYPSEAEARGEQGVAQLAFSVDRAGGVHNARIVRSSGSGVLDRATLALIERAQPLPPPPPEIHGSQIAIAVPIRYSVRR
jgi:protein TonB